MRIPWYKLPFSWMRPYRWRWFYNDLLDFWAMKRIKAMGMYDDSHFRIPLDKKTLLDIWNIR